MSKRAKEPKCGELLHSYGESKVRCVLPKGHKGWHKMSEEGKQTADRDLARFMQKSFARAERVRQETAHS